MIEVLYFIYLELINGLTELFCKKYTKDYAFPKKLFRALMKMVFINKSCLSFIQEHLHINHYNVFMEYFTSIQDINTYAVTNSIEEVEYFTKLFPNIYLSTSLLSLDLSGYNLSKCVSALVKQFKKIDKLDTLNLSYCVLGKDSSTLSDGFKYLIKLNHLNLSGNEYYNII